MLTETQRRVQNAFTMAIIANCSIDTIGLIMLYSSSFVTSYFNGFAGFIVAALILAAPIVLSAVALSMLRGIQPYELYGKYKVFYVISRILSSVTLVTTAIVAFLVLIAVSVAASLYQDHK